MDLFIWFIAVFLAYFVKGVCGFANTLVLSSIMSFSTNNINITPVDLLIGIPSNVILATKERKKIDPKICVPLSLLVIAGIIPGAIFLKNVNVTSVKLLFGVVIVGIGLQILIQDRFLQNKEKGKPNPVLLVFLGLLSGVICGLFGIGAILAAYVNSVAKDVPTFKANMCVVFVVDNIVRFILYTIWGILTISAYKTAATLIIPMLVGLGVGMLVGKKLNEKAVKLIVVIMLILSGVSLIANTLMG